MGEIWEDRMVSERWPRVGKNEKVPVGAEAGGWKKAKAKRLEVEHKTSAWFQKRKATQNKKPKGIPQYEEWIEDQHKSCVDWTEHLV